MPILLLMLALVADVGSLQVEKVRLRWAQDMALVDAVTEIDPAHYAATGQLQVDSTAVDVYRAYLVANLAPMRGLLAGGATPESIARQAEIAVVNSVPAENPFTGRALDRPAICARMRVPLMSGLLHLAGLSNEQTLTIEGEAEIKGDVR